MMISAKTITKSIGFYILHSIMRLYFMILVWMYTMTPDALPVKYNWKWKISSKETFLVQANTITSFLLYCFLFAVTKIVAVYGNFLHCRFAKYLGDRIYVMFVWVYSCAFFILRVINNDAWSAINWVN